MIDAASRSPGAESTPFPGPFAPAFEFMTDAAQRGIRGTLMSRERCSSTGTKRGVSSSPPVEQLLEVLDGLGRECGGDAWIDRRSATGQAEPVVSNAGCSGD